MDPDDITKEVPVQVEPDEECRLIMDPDDLESLSAWSELLGARK